MAVMLGNATMAQALDARTAGQDAGRAVLRTFGTRDALNRNLSQPMTDPAVSLKTIDGVTSFQANLTAPSSAKFLELLIQPSGTGDLQQVLISQDLNTDGAIDNVHVVPNLVSGVCANGYISCNAGTWDNCLPFRWTSDAAGRITEAPAAITDLGGCYCINSSCGSNLVWMNSGIVLKDLGGGIVNAVHDSNPDFTITSVATDLTTISYFGQVTGKAATAANSVAALTGSPAIATLSGYYRNWPLLSAGRDTAALSQANDPTSLYYFVANSGAARQAQGKLTTCVIDRVGQIATTVTPYTDSGTGSICTDHFLYMRIRQVTDSLYRLQILDTSPLGLIFPHNNCVWQSADPDGWHTIKDIVLPAPDPSRLGKIMAATFELKNISGIGCFSGVGSVDGIINGFGTAIQTSLICPAKDAQLPSYDWDSYFEYKVDQYTEAVDDRCTLLAANPECRLKEEEIDGVLTSQNFNPTGLTPLPSCKNFSGQVGTNRICRNWWRKRRTYVCDSQPYDFSAVGKRYGQVTTTTADNGGTLDFQDLRLGAGGWTPAAGSLVLPQRDPVATCEPACKTRQAKLDTQVTTTGTVTEMRVPAQSYDIFYRSCVDNVCPAEAGEEILKECQCLNEFVEAGATLQALRLAGKDSICSSNQKKPMQ